MEFRDVYRPIGMETVSDFNGDGRSDLLGVSPNGRWEIASFSNAVPPDLDPLPDQLKTVENGKGGTTTFDHELSSQYENELMPFIMQLVSSISIEDGVGGSYTTGYNYSGGLYDYGEKEFLGFEIIEKTNPDSSFEKTYYYQDHFKKHRPDLTQFYDSEGGSILTETDYTWGTYPASPTTWAFVKLTQKKTTYEGNSSYYTQEDYTYDDSNGFPINIHKNGTDANGAAIEQITRYTDYQQYPAGSWTWRVVEETLTGAQTGLARKVTYDYDNYGNMTNKIFWRTSSTYYPAIVYDHDDYGNVTTETDGLNNTTTIQYDTATNTYPSTITNAKNQITTKTWDYKFGKEDTVTDPNSNVTDYGYDPFGRITNIAYPDGGYAVNDYTNYDLSSLPRYILTKTLESGSIATGDYIEKKEYYDGLDRTVKTVTDGINDVGASTQIITKTSYDNMGRKGIVKGPYFVEDEASGNYYYEDTDYDKLGRVTSVTSPNSQYGTVTISYDYTNNPFTTVITDPDSKQKTEKRDHLGRIIEVIEHANTGNQSTKYGYNAAGDMTKVTNVLNIDTLIAYDLRGLKTGMDDPDMGVWSYTYDENGNLWTQTDAKLDMITFGYDDLNRIETKTYTIYDSQETEETKDVTYTYDLAINGIGQLYSVTNTDVTTVYDEYDAMGRVKSVTKTITGDQARNTYTEYDKSGKVEYIEYPDDFVVNNYYYPGTSLLNTVTGTEYGGSAVEYARCEEYEPTGKIGRIYHAYNDTETAYTYDLKSTRLTHLLTTGPGGDIQEKSYTYTEAGDIWTITDVLEGITYTYTYDNLHRLLSETSTDTALPTIAEELIYYYNDSAHINAVSTINYNGANYNFTYDANGNMLTGYDFTNPGSITQRTITWNADNMPTQIVHSVNGTTSFTYAGDGARAKKTAGGNTTYYINNSYEIKNGVATKYVFAGNLRVATIEGTSTHIFHKDHLGSSTAMTNSSGGSVETTEYLPFGGMREHTGTDLSGYKFTDQELDSSSNLYNYDARLYDPIIGRFVSADTLVPAPYNPQSLNRYSYVINNPLIYTDPSGHDKEDDPCANGNCMEEIVVRGKRPERWQDPSMIVLSGSVATTYPYPTFPKFPIAPSSIFAGARLAGGYVALFFTILTIPGDQSINMVRERRMKAEEKAKEKTEKKAKKGLKVDQGRERTPAEYPEDYDNVKNSPAKKNKNTGEIWEKDRLHKNHWEVYKNKKNWEKRKRDRSIWNDGRLKEKF